MKFAALLLSFLFSALAVSAQVDPRCPVISVDGPPGIPQPGEPYVFNADVKPLESKITYKWTVSYGTIAEGQGTPTIRVRLRPDEFAPTATVEIGGLPDECPKVASEYAVADPPLQPKKLDTFSLPLSSKSDQRFQIVAGAINNDPTSQAFVFLPAVKSIRDAFVQRLFKFARGDFDFSRVTYVDTAVDSKFIEVWLVPPGATPPSKCEACGKVAIKPDCPTISIVGPASLTFVGNTMTFTVDKPEYFKGSYKWTVDHGTIENGQGSPSIEVRAPEVPDYINVTATVELVGLPDKCINKASETAGVYREYVPYATDTYGRLSRNDEKARLQSAFEKLSKEKQDFVALIKIVIPASGKVTFEERVRTIKALLTSLRLNTKKAVFVNDGTGELSTTIYLMPKSNVPAVSKP
jgi:hypothetical protein